MLGWQPLLQVSSKTAAGPALRDLCVGWNRVAGRTGLKSRVWRGGRLERRPQNSGRRRPRIGGILMRICATCALMRRRRMAQRRTDAAASIRDRNIIWGAGFGGCPATRSMKVFDRGLPREVQSGGCPKLRPKMGAQGSDVDQHPRFRLRLYSRRLFKAELNSRARSPKQMAFVELRAPRACRRAHSPTTPAPHLSAASAHKCIVAQQAFQQPGGTHVAEHWPSGGGRPTFLVFGQNWTQIRALRPTQKWVEFDQR